MCACEIPSSDSCDVTINDTRYDALNNTISPDVIEKALACFVPKQIITCALNYNNITNAAFSVDFIKCLKDASRYAS